MKDREYEKEKKANRGKGRKEGPRCAAFSGTCRSSSDVILNCPAVRSALCTFSEQAVWQKKGGKEEGREEGRCEKEDRNRA